MNNIFELKRFGKVLMSDITFYWGQGWMRFLAVVAMIPFVGLVTSHTGDRISFYLFITLTYALFTHFYIYGGVNNKKGGIDYVMLPATSLEKLVAMTLLSAIVSPLLLLGAILLVDTVMVALPIRYYSDNYISFNIMFNDSNMERFGFYLVSMAAFIYGNLLFKKAKAAKTIVAIAIFSAISLLILAEINHLGDSNLITEDMLKVLFFGALPVTMLILSYRRIRRMQI